MKTKITLLAATVVLLASQQAMAAPFEPTFSDYSFPGSQYTVDAAANAFFSTHYGITIDNAYLYLDSRDTFDGVGVSVGEVSDIGTPQTGTISFLDTTDFVSIDYWSIHPTSYSAFDGSNNLIDTFSVGSDQLGTYLFNGAIISYLTWSSEGGYGQVSGLRYDYDGTTDGRNVDITRDVPAPAPLALLGMGLLGVYFSNRVIRQTIKS